MKQFPAVHAVPCGVRGIPDPFFPDTSPVAPHLRRAILHTIRSDSALFYSAAVALAGAPLSPFETLTGDHTASCPLPAHPVSGDPVHRRPLRLHHGTSGAGWRCSACGSGTPAQFLTRLFLLPSTNGEAAAWNLAARLLHLDPADVQAKDWMLWDSDRAHFEWGAALARTRADLDRLRPIYRASFPTWRDTEILHFPTTGRGTCLSAYRVRGRLTQLEEVTLPPAPGALAAPEARRSVKLATGIIRPDRLIRYHHWSQRHPSRLSRSVTGVYPDTPTLPPLASTEPGIAHIIQGPEEAASARLVLPGQQVLGTPYGPPSLGQAEIDALAAFDRVFVWARHDPAGHGFQNQIIRLLRACGIDARRVRWADAGQIPRGYHVTAYLRDGGTIRATPDGELDLQQGMYNQSQQTLALPEAG